MRLRNVKGARELIAVHKQVIQEAELYRGKWKEVFQNEKPIHIEVGMGKGRFITEMAEKYPDNNFIGIEKYSSVLVRALERLGEIPPANLCFIRMDAEDITRVFCPGEINRIYLNFSDPWPKERHAKRRLTSEHFLERYDKILDKNGMIVFKTDNKALFEFSLEEIRSSKHWKLDDYTFDLHNSKYKDNNIMTEYEEKFSSEGKKINFLVAARQ